MLSFKTKNHTFYDERQYENRGSKSENHHARMYCWYSGLIMMMLGYYMSTEMFGKFQELTMALLTPFIILFLTVAGAYLFFRSSVSIFFKKNQNRVVSLSLMSSLHLRLCIE